jgi:hypothetical protein
VCSSDLPLEFAADRSASGLNVFIDQIRQVIEANHGVLPATEGMQVFSRADAAPTMGKSIPEALAWIVAAGAGKLTN